MVHADKNLLAYLGRLLTVGEITYWKQRAKERKLPYYQTIGVYKAQEIVKKKTGSLGKGVKVGIIDSGVYRIHPALEHLVVTGRNVLSDKGSSHYYDETGHGTFVAGIILENDLVLPQT
ncbi:S8 family serine peptidase [Candidatus Woesearchaeota archaeon]|nr:S8 family serine peptidase [Candidatus Woesearchaeota archaeon]